MPTPTRRHPLPDAQRQTRLAARLRTLPEDRALGVLRPLIARDPKIGLALANRVLRDPKRLTQLFREGLRQSNETTIRFWIEAIGPRLGAARTIGLIRDEAADDSSIARRALYWLPALVKKDQSAKTDLNALRELFAP